MKGKKKLFLSDVVAKLALAAGIGSATVAPFALGIADGAAGTSNHEGYMAQAGFSYFANMVGVRALELSHARRENDDHRSTYEVLPIATALYSLIGAPSVPMIASASYAIGNGIGRLSEYV
jgi:hypothetical protein